MSWLGVATLLACLLPSCCAGASATPIVHLQVRLAPDHPGSRTTIELSLSIYEQHSIEPNPVTGIEMLLPAGMNLASTTLGQSNCTPEALLTAGLAGCSANARIGYGNATAILPTGSGSVAEQATLTALMGPPTRSRVEVLFYAQAGYPVFAQLVLPSSFREGSPPFGGGLVALVPLTQIWPEGPFLSLERFNSTIGPLNLTYHERVKGHTVAYKPLGMRIPPECPTHGYPFRAIVSFKDGTRLIADQRVPCAGA